MRALASVVLLLSLVVASRPAHTVASHCNRTSPLRHGPSSLSLAFTANVGQADPSVLYEARGRSGTVFATADGVTLTTRCGSLRMSLAGATTRVCGERLLPSKVNYLTGPDPSSWHTNLPAYAAVRYEGQTPSVSAVIYGHEGRLEYDLVVAPGVDVSTARLRFEGQASAETTTDGDVILKFATGQIRHERASVYQEIGGQRTSVDARVTLRDDGEIAFLVDTYDPSLPLVIDPVLDYGAFLGGGIVAINPAGVAVDSAGATYVAGMTEPGITVGGFPLISNACIAKFAPDGFSLVYATYLPANVAMAVGGVAVDSGGSVIITGTTSNPDFPVTPGAVDLQTNGYLDVFVVKLAPDGASVDFAAVLGGMAHDDVSDIAVDGAGAVYVTGCTSSTDFPITVHALDGSFAVSDAFVAKLSPDGSSLEYSTFLGGSASEGGSESIAVDGAGSAYVTGGTYSTDFPVTSGAFDTQFDADDGFVAKLNPAGSALLYASFLGPGLGTDICVTRDGRAFVAGLTTHSNYPTTPGAFAASYQGGFTDAFVTAIAPDGRSLVYSTFLGGSGQDGSLGVAVDSEGAAYVTGDTSSDDFPSTSGAFEPPPGTNGSFLTKLARDGSRLAYSARLGGSAIAVDPSGTATFVASTSSPDYPTTPGAYSRTFNLLPYSLTAVTALTRVSPDGSALDFSTFIDEPSSEYASGVAVDAAGAAYLTGTTMSFSFPTTPGSAQTAFGGIADAFVVKLAPDEASVVFATFLGGDSWERGTAIAVDAAGAIVVTGSTSSTDFPTTVGAYDRTLDGGGDAFVTKLAPDGSSLAFSTLLGGSLFFEIGMAVALRPNGAIYVSGTTTSPDFPTTPGAPDTEENTSGDAFVVKLTPDGSRLKRSTLFGGLATDEGQGLVVDRTGVTVVGTTSYRCDDCTEPSSGFVVKSDRKLTRVVYSKVIGGSAGSGAVAVAVDAAGATYVTGATSSPDFPTTPGAYRTTILGDYDGFVMKLAGDGTVLYSTLLGGASDGAAGVAVDASGEAVVTGTTYSQEFPTTVDAPDTTFDGRVDAFVAVFSSDGSALRFGTFLGGGGVDLGLAVALGPGASVYVAGVTDSQDFPDAGVGLQSGSNAFIERIDWAGGKASSRARGPGH